jgi:hypothetical protein
MEPKVKSGWRDPKPEDYALPDAGSGLKRAFDRSSSAEEEGMEDESRSRREGVRTEKIQYSRLKSLGALCITCVVSLAAGYGIGRILHNDPILHPQIESIVQEIKSSIKAIEASTAISTRKLTDQLNETHARLKSIAEASDRNQQMMKEQTDNVMLELNRIREVSEGLRQVNVHKAE